MTRPNLIEHSYQAECGACDATGIYVGMCERDGVGVVCHICKGTGETEYKVRYRPFQGRREHPDVTHVIPKNGGYILDPQHAGETAMAAADFYAGQPFHISQHRQAKRQCPGQYAQSALNIGGMDIDRDGSLGCQWGSFSDCANYPEKAKCWEKAEGTLIQLERKRGLVK